MSQPIFYETLYGDRVDGILEQSKADIIEAKEHMHRRFHEILLRVASYAYAQGLKDGFAQGVAAESQSRASET